MQEFEGPDDRTLKKCGEIVPPTRPRLPVVPRGNRENKPHLWQSGDIWRPEKQL
jgi:hypothetical protein